MPRKSSLLCAAALALALSPLVAPLCLSSRGSHSHASSNNTRGMKVGERTRSGSLLVASTADVVRAVVRHGRRNVVVKMTFTDLRHIKRQVPTQP